MCYRQMSLLPSMKRMAPSSCFSVKWKCLGIWGGVKREKARHMLPSSFVQPYNFPLVQRSFILVVVLDVRWLNHSTRARIVPILSTAMCTCKHLPQGKIKLRSSIIPNVWGKIETNPWTLGSLHTHQHADTTFYSSDKGSFTNPGHSRTYSRAELDALQNLENF